MSYMSEGGFSTHSGVRGSSTVFEGQGWERVPEEQALKGQGRPNWRVFELSG